MMVRVELNDHGQKRIVAARAAKPGDTVFRLEGSIVDTPSKYTLQIGRDEHLAPPEDSTIPPWRFVNHDCAPNVWIRDRQMVALRPIEEGEEITFDYNSTEYDMADPFECWCAQREAAHAIRGFKHLSESEQERLRDILAPYLAELLPQARQRA